MLFDDNLGFFGFTIPKEAVIKEKSDLASIEKGFSRGNMFNDLYDEYKDTYRCFKSHRDIGVDEEWKK